MMLLGQGTNRSDASHAVPYGTATPTLRYQFGVTLTFADSIVGNRTCRKSGEVAIS